MVPGTTETGTANSTDWRRDARPFQLNHHPRYRLEGGGRLREIRFHLHGCRFHRLIIQAADELAEPLVQQIRQAQGAVRVFLAGILERRQQAYEDVPQGQRS